MLGRTAAWGQDFSVTKESPSGVSLFLGAYTSPGPRGGGCSKTPSVVRSHLMWGFRERGKSQTQPQRELGQAGPRGGRGCRRDPGARARPGTPGAAPSLLQA